jgi:hypothetical protein
VTQLLISGLKVQVLLSSPPFLNVTGPLRPSGVALDRDSPATLRFVRQQVEQDDLALASVFEQARIDIQGQRRRCGRMRGWNVRFAAFLIACSCAFAACSEPDLSTDAVAVVEAYLAQVSAPTADRGWSLLLPLTRESTFDSDLDRYVERAQRIDWTTFDYEVRGVERDESYAYRVSISVTGELPELLADVTYSDDEAVGDVATFYVRFRPFVDGSGGIHHFR